jgi:hypothetical protein
MRRALAIAVLVGCGGARDPEPVYEGCDLDDPEVVCDAGASCVESAVVASGNGFCSLSCVVAADDCPAAGDWLTAACHQPDGALDAQCYVECPGDETCPLSTTCVALTEGGVDLKLCLPR